MSKFDCNNIKKVEDITSQCNYEDEHGGDEKIDLVSCCQDNGYNELKNKLNTYKNKFQNIPEKDILKAMCECCNEIPFRERTHKKYDNCVEKKLGIKQRKIEKGGTATVFPLRKWENSNSLPGGLCSALFINFELPSGANFPRRFFIFIGKRGHP